MLNVTIWNSASTCSFCSRLTRHQSGESLLAGGKEVQSLVCFILAVTIMKGYIWILKPAESPSDLHYRSRATAQRPLPGKPF